MYANANILSFPLLVPVNCQFREYIGYIQFQNNQYPVEIKLKSNGLVGDSSNIIFDDLDIKTTDEFSQILQPYLLTIKNRAVQCKDLNQFFYELKDVIEKIPVDSRQQQQQQQQQKLPNADSKKQLPIQVYTMILKELEDIGWKRIVKINDSLNEFQLLFSHDKREFIVNFNITDQYPQQSVITNHPLISLYSDSTRNNIISTSNIDDNSTINNMRLHLNDLYKSCKTIRQSMNFIEKLLEYYHDFFKVMDEIDDNSWVLDPEHPSCWISERRLNLGNNTSLYFNVNPDDPFILPRDCRFLGPSTLIEPYKKNLTKNWQEWKPNLSLLDNFRNILSVEFSKKPTLGSIDDQQTMVECGICYSLRDALTNNLPSMTCENIQCKKPFHQDCIYEWFKSLPSVQQTFGVISGPCPYCTTKIIVSFNQK
ncbi:hypothetical protein DLAC_01042 [Tieghemostelium lacteum]|uniref:RING-type domain-containing protein n=1 Tax=Tieghemostelium lacteum TaxID=361077 RepID=A0A152A7L6_TIELA|nr:hypothetical protein DLAC_01042 [Tieghemostelium lacteum]|eukprot:KYR02222.1 hypothetical protein DLAC_01042 [Tieghemostelium lacteum]